jgi:hypothetical protein
MGERVSWKEVLCFVFFSMSMTLETPRNIKHFDISIIFSANIFKAKHVCFYDFALEQSANDTTFGT